MLCLVLVCVFHARGSLLKPELSILSHRGWAIRAGSTQLACSLSWHVCGTVQRTCLMLVIKSDPGLGMLWVTPIYGYVFTACNPMYTIVTVRLLLQAAEQAQKLREARKEQADMEGNVNDMERAQDFLKAGNVKVLSLPSTLLNPIPFTPPS